MRTLLFAFAATTLAWAAQAAPEAPPKTCIAGPIIFLRGAEPHVEELKTQLRAFLITEVGYGARGDATLFPFATPRDGIRALKLDTDALGGTISAQVACEDHIDLRDALATDYMTKLYEKVRAQRFILQGLQLVALSDSIPQQPPGERLEATKQ
jgi:hypothetical protein